MAWIDGDDDVAAGYPGRRGALDDCRRDVAVQIDHDTIAVTLVGPGREAPRTHGMPQIEHDAQLTVGAHAAADGADAAGARGQRGKRLAQAAVLEIDHEAIGAAQHKDTVRGRPIEIQNDARALLLRPDAQIFDAGTGLDRLRQDHE